MYWISGDMLEEKTREKRQRMAELDQTQIIEDDETDCEDDIESVDNSQIESDLELPEDTPLNKDGLITECAAKRLCSDQAGYRHD